MAWVAVNKDGAEFIYDENLQGVKTIGNLQ